MSDQKPLVNRVAASGLITIDLEQYFPTTPLVVFDLKDYLFMELILKEKDFREAIKEHDWSQYQDKILLVYCSTDAIIPLWSYMLVASSAAPFAKDIYQGTKEAYYQSAYEKIIEELAIEKYAEQRIVIKGCSDVHVPKAAYLKLTQRLRPIAKSIMFGEPCSTVPIYKKPRKS